MPLKGFLKFLCSMFVCLLSCSAFSSLGSIKCSQINLSFFHVWGRNKPVWRTRLDHTPGGLWVFWLSCSHIKLQAWTVAVGSGGHHTTRTSAESTIAITMESRCLSKPRLLSSKYRNLTLQQFIKKIPKTLVYSAVLVSRDPSVSQRAP